MNVEIKQVFEREWNKREDEETIKEICMDPEVL
jgi:hypothetical protein